MGVEQALLARSLQEQRLRPARGPEVGGTETGAGPTGRVRAGRGPTEAVAEALAAGARLRS